MSNDASPFSNLVVKKTPQPWPRSLPVSAAFFGAVAYLSPTLLVARSPWVRHHSELAVLLGLLALLLVYWAYYTEQSHGGAKARRGWGAAGLNLLWFLAGACVAWALVLGLGYGRFRQVEARVAASGLRAEMPPDDAQDTSDRNGQMILRRLEGDQAFKSLFDGSKSKPDLSESIAKALRAAAGREGKLPETLAVLRGRRAQWQPALKLLKQAQAAPTFSWNIRYSVPFDQIEIPRFADFLRLARVSCAEALLLEADGNHAGAEAQLKRIQWLADRLSESPSLIAVMIAIAMQNLIHDAATPLYRRGRGSALSSRHEADDKERAFRTSLRREMLLWPTAALGEIGSSGRNIVTGEAWSFWSRLATWIYLPWVYLDLAGGLSDNLETLKCMESPLPQATQCLVKLEEAVERNGWFLQAVALPKFDEMLRRAGACTARQEIAVLSREAGAFHKRTGRWPSGFGELPRLRELPDPFTGKPMITRVKDGRFEILSVGADGQEDGEKKVEGTAKDIFVRL